MVSVQALDSDFLGLYGRSGEAPTHLGLHYYMYNSQMRK